MKKSTKLTIISSCILQFILGVWNIGMIFFDSFPSHTETALLLGLIFTIHGLSVHSHDRNNPWKSYFVIVIGYFIASIILSLQDEFPNWYVTGMGGINLTVSFSAMIWPAVTSLATLMTLQGKNISDKKQSLKKWIRYFICIWTILILTLAILTSNMPSSSMSFIDFLISPLFFVFYLSFGVGAIIGGGTLFLVLSLHLNRISK